MNSEVTFASLELADPILRAIGEAGYTSPTPIQVKAIPQVLAGRDLLAAAQTGTGKTAGFTLPLLHILSQTHAHPHPPGRPRCLIMTPTRELAAQVEESVKTYGKHLALSSLVMFGGVNINPQISALKKRVDILVATPGRLLDHVGQRTLDLSGVEILVLDEADRMLDLGFAADLDVIFQALPRNRQTLLFSATFAPGIVELAGRRLRKPLRIDATPRQTGTPAVRQWAVPVDKKKKSELFLFMRRDRGWRQALVFVRTRQGCEELLARLVGKGIVAATLHGERTQAERQDALAAFKAGAVDILIATDVAARGIDIGGLPLVVNYDLPDQPEDYIHRIGRTGRAGLAGEAVSLVCADEAPRLAAIERLLKKPLSRDEEPGFEPQHRVPATASGKLPRPNPGKRAAPRPGKPGGRSNWVDEFAGTRTGKRMNRSKY